MFLSFFLFVVAHMSPTTYSIHSKKKANHSKKLCNVLIKGKIISLASIYYLYLALVDSSTLDQNAKKKENKMIKKKFLEHAEELCINILRLKKGKASGRQVFLRRKNLYKNRSHNITNYPFTRPKRT